MTYTLFQLNEFIRRVLTLNLAEPVWISCEIGQANWARGHLFMSLVQKEETSEEVIARSDAVCWQRNYRRLKKRLGKELDSLLTEGMQVRLQVRVQFNERYGLKLLVEDADPSYTLGELERMRRQTLETLQREGLLERNATLSLPPVLQRIAVVSSETAAGYGDFCRQLEQNGFGYRFRADLFPAAMQGQLVEPEVMQQLRRIKPVKQRYDCVVILRGGGARLDLAAFDRRELCRAVAQFPLPVLSGIGHEIDETVLDRVVHTPLRTPTALAEFLIDRAFRFESTLQELGFRLQQLGRHRLKASDLQLIQLEQSLHYHSRQKVTEQRHQLQQIDQRLPQLTRQHLKDARQTLARLESQVELLAPETALRRGFTLTLKEDRMIGSARQLKAGDHIRIRFGDGEVDGRVE